MYWLPQSNFEQERGQNALNLFNSLCRVAEEPNENIYDGCLKKVKKDVRIGACFCRNAYELTFEKNSQNDIYGKDVDLTFRLQGFADRGEIVMNEGFANRIMKMYSRVTQKDSHPDVTRIVGPWPQKIQGYREQISIYKVPANC